MKPQIVPPACSVDSKSGIQDIQLWEPFTLMSGLILQQIFLVMNSDIPSPLMFVYSAVHILSPHPTDKEGIKVSCHVDVK